MYPWIHLPLIIESSSGVYQVFGAHYKFDSEWKAKFIKNLQANAA